MSLFFNYWIFWTWLENYTNFSNTNYNILSLTFNLLLILLHSFYSLCLQLNFIIIFFFVKLFYKFYLMLIFILWFLFDTLKNLYYCTLFYAVFFINKHIFLKHLVTINIHDMQIYNYLSLNLIVLLVFYYLHVIFSIWARAAGPRFRIDQMSKITWKDYIFLGLGVIFITIFLCFILNCDETLLV